MEPKFLTFEELARDHERLVGEVEALKREFEEHTHSYDASYASPYTTMQTRKPDAQ